jgi:ribonucleoside-diphosphate reductase alpha chain
MSGKYEYYFCVPNVVRVFLQDNGYEIPMEADCIKDTWDGSIGKPIVEFIDNAIFKIGVKFKKSTEIKTLDKLDLMSKLMKNVDSSISVTYALPHDAKWQDTYDLIMEANRRGVKSIAAFPDKKMYGVVSDISFKELALNLKSTGVEISTDNFSEDELKELNLIVENKINTSAPKRKKELEADLYQVKVRGKKYLMAVGLQDGAPYEMFGGVIPDTISIKIPQKGKMIKVKNGHYKLDLGTNGLIEDFGSLFTGEEQILFRMVSISLRHGIPIKFLVDQLSKAAEDVVDIASATSRVLKKYIINGEKSGGKCPTCGKQELIYVDGCVSCACGWSKGCG